MSTQNDWLSEKDQRFLAKRAIFVRSWPYVGTIFLALLAGLAAWLLSSRPLLANPMEVASRLGSHSIPDSTMALMAGLLPVLVLLCLGMAALFVLFVFAALANEKRYLAILRRAPDGKQPPPAA